MCTRPKTLRRRASSVCRRQRGGLYGFAVRTATRRQREVEVAPHEARAACDVFSLHAVCAVWGRTTLWARPARQAVGRSSQSGRRVLCWAFARGEAEAGSMQRSFGACSPIINDGGARAGRGRRCSVRSSNPTMRLTHVLVHASAVGGGARRARGVRGTAVPGAVCARVRQPFRVVIWLILPVVICLSQRLSHACLSINLYTVKLRMAH